MNKHVRVGFFMTEFLLYLALSACSAIFIMRYIYGTSMRLRATTLQTDRIASLASALDAICNDVVHAPCAVHEWRTLNDHELAWQHGNVRIGWKLEDGSFKRTQQTYNLRKQKWKRQVTHIAVEDVDAVQYIPQYQGNALRLMTIKLCGKVAVGKTHCIERSVLLQQNVVI
ncbi:MAG: hypothetical protein AB7F19_07315 [Candidatus Babeliales bacterium]